MFSKTSSYRKWPTYMNKPIVVINDLPITSASWASHHVASAHGLMA